MSEPGERPADLACAWCGDKSPAEATHCRACGAALAQRESLGDLVIPGVTTVDPELAAYANRPLRIPGHSPTQMVAGHTMGAAASADPMGLLALGALAAVAAQELAGASQGRGGVPDPEKIGVPSAPVAEMARRLDEDARQARKAPPPPPPPPPVEG